MDDTPSQRAAQAAGARGRRSLSAGQLNQHGLQIFPAAAAPALQAAGQRDSDVFQRESFVSALGAGGVQDDASGHVQQVTAADTLTFNETFRQEVVASNQGQQ